jgi:AcrR family transcriptional regulator
MGIKERQERDKAAVRRSILDAARELFVAEGYQNVSIRKIADRVEYSPAAIYSYFPSKDDIFFALAEEGFHLLSIMDGCALDELQSVPPLDRIRSVFHGLYRFSVEQPQYFALMFVDRSVPKILQHYERFGFVRALKQELIDQVQECIDAGEFPAHVDPNIAFRLLSSSVMGVALMRLVERLGPEENGADLAHDALEVAIAGLKSGISLRAHTSPCAPETGVADRETQDPLPLRGVVR